MTGIFSIKPGLRVLVTAGASGIGKAIAEAFDAAGAKIHVCDIAPEILDKCRKEKPGWNITSCDVSDETQVAALFAEVKKTMGGLDVLVNNAGIAGPTATVEDMKPAEWDTTVRVNLNGQFYCVHHAVPLLKKSDSAAIICISSIAGRLAYANRAPYAATKWAIRGLVESLAWELGPHGIRVNALLPGIVEGPRIEIVIRNRAEKEGVPYAEMEEKYKNMASLQRMVSAQDVANQALFLCTPGGRNISGQSISVDGHVRSL
ncbi:MAG TPA: SDR family oxidoreductase [Alphaproteobacteria bacterium]|jgi:NAD(P)-dependent dehydrogenase (short-subunit alcohol dehydrogenase family)